MEKKEGRLVGVWYFFAGAATTSGWSLTRGTGGFMSWRGRKSLAALALALALLVTSVPAGAAGWTRPAGPVAGWEELWNQVTAWLGLGAERPGAVVGGSPTQAKSSSSIDPNGPPSPAGPSSPTDPSGQSAGTSDSLFGIDPSGKL